MITPYATTRKKYEVSLNSEGTTVAMPARCLFSAMLHFRAMVKSLEASEKFGYVRLYAVWRKSDILTAQEFASILKPDIDYLQEKQCLNRHCLPVLDGQKYAIFYSKPRD